LYIAKVSGKLQVTLPKAVADQSGIRVGDELGVRVVGRFVQIERKSGPPEARREMEGMLVQFDVLYRTRIS
jgi:bifunctional DNA-binding transcriptional regulator/antitoxin component of YhaV-PrlF toxin-antitoxin module